MALPVAEPEPGLSFSAEPDPDEALLRTVCGTPSRPNRNSRRLEPGPAEFTNPDAASLWGVPVRMLLEGGNWELHEADAWFWTKAGGYRGHTRKDRGIPAKLGQFSYPGCDPVAQVQADVSNPVSTGQLFRAGFRSGMTFHQFHQAMMSHPEAGGAHYWWRVVHDRYEWDDPRSWAAQTWCATVRDEYQKSKGLSRVETDGSVTVVQAPVVQLSKEAKRPAEKTMQRMVHHIRRHPGLNQKELLGSIDWLLGNSDRRARWILQCLEEDGRLQRTKETRINSAGRRYQATVWALTAVERGIYGGLDQDKLDQLARATQSRIDAENQQGRSEVSEAPGPEGPVLQVVDQDVAPKLDRGEVHRHDLNPGLGFGLHRELDVFTSALDAAAERRCLGFDLKVDRDAVPSLAVRDPDRGDGARQVFVHLVGGPAAADVQALEGWRFEVDPDLLAGLDLGELHGGLRSG